MPYLPHAERQRPERARFNELIPVVLRFADGNRASGNLQVVSVTGGLLSVPRPLTPGVPAKVMFLTSAGSVLGVAELLSPLSWDQQPFRFVSLHHDDETRLQTAIQASLQQNRREHTQSRRQMEQVDNFRAW